MLQNLDLREDEKRREGRNFAPNRRERDQEREEWKLRSQAQRVQMAEHLASIFGTEKDRVNCPFYFKIGACRHGDRCSRLHTKPSISPTLLLSNMYQRPDLLTPGVDPQGPTLDAPKIQTHFDVGFMFLCLLLFYFCFDGLSCEYHQMSCRCKMIIDVMHVLLAYFVVYVV